MKGNEQGACAGCGLKKGDRDRNAGWYNLSPRGNILSTMLFCPACAAALLVGLDERMTEGKKNPNLRAVLIGDLNRLRRLFHHAQWDAVRIAEAQEALDWLEAICSPARPEAPGTPPAPPGA